MTNKKKLYVIQTKDDKVRVEAKDRDEAFAKFFLEIESGKVPLSKLGSIVILKDRKEEYPFRTVPLLYSLKLISGADAVSNIIACTGVEQKEAEQMLLDNSFKDSRLIPLMRKLERCEVRE